jgi:AcrR family transcriptional regulator
MRGMSRDYLGSGRARQKQRTRDQLVAAARELIASGETPRVEDVAAAAGVSRPTAYRYFASKAELLAASFPETAAASALPEPPPTAVGDRVAAVAGFVIDRVQEAEPQQRAMLRLSLDGLSHELPLRQGRAIPWFVEALTPMLETTGDAGVHRLALALRAACGIETRVWLTDIAGLTPAQVSSLQRWMVDALLRHAQETPPPS